MPNKFGSRRVPDCRCDDSLTCGPCLAAAPPWHYTPSTPGERQQRPKDYTSALMTAQELRNIAASWDYRLIELPTRDCVKVFTIPPAMRDTGHNAAIATLGPGGRYRITFTVME